MYPKGRSWRIVTGQSAFPPSLERTRLNLWQVNLNSTKLTGKVKLVRQRKKSTSPQSSSSVQLGEIINNSVHPRQKSDWKAADGSTHQTRLAWIEVPGSARASEPKRSKRLGWWWTGPKRKPNLIMSIWPIAATAFHGPLPALQRPLADRTILQRSKDDLGLDHYEGRSWRGFHHHLVLSALAYLFV